ncbi:MAG: N-acetylglucosamine kinase [Gaiellales bacterium]
MTAGLVLGCDGGNTKTVAVVARGDGTIVGWGRAGSSDVHDNDAALHELERAIVDACAMAGATPADVHRSVLGLAGADWPEDFELLRETAGGLLGGEATVLNDAVNAIRCGTDDGVGVVVSCGTGGTAAGMGADATVYHRGFWPEPSGAREIGRRGLRTVQRAHLGIDPPTALTERALARYGAADPDDLLHVLTRRGRGPETDSRWFCPDVLDAADAGDAAARAIVAREGTVLGQQAAVCARACDFADGFPLVLVGGVFRHPSPLLRDAVRAVVPAGVPVEAAWEPAVAALLRAFDALGTSVDEAVRASLPDAAVFATV